jgi:putative nucleotidyltransferase-like protein
MSLRSGIPGAEGYSDEFHTAALSPDQLLVARSLLLDRAATVAVGHLRAVGIPSILLKGAAIATWLYGAGQVRPYVDVDLLVPPSQFERAKETLAELGYEHRLRGADPAELGPLEQDLVGPDNICIDLHYGLLGTTAAVERCWEVLSRHTIPLCLPGGEVSALDLPARTMHLALHAAQNGPVDRKAVADLERGLVQVGRDCWRDAAGIADEMGAAQAFAAGLRLLPAGEALADELSLTRRMTVELALRTRSAPTDAIFFERLGQAPGLRRKSALVVRKLFPTPALLRSNSTMARRGPLGLALAWISHPLSVAGRLVPALVAWFKACRATRRSGR